MSNDAPFIRPVPQILPGAALTVSTGKPRGSLSFPTAGGVQAIDESGAVLDLAGAGGAVTATVTDTATNSSSTALSLTHALSAGVGANGIGVTQRFIIPNSLGVLGSAGQFTVSYTDATSGSEDSALGITLQVGGAGAGVLTITSPTAGAPRLTAAGAADSVLNLTGSGTGSVRSFIDAAATNSVLTAHTLSRTVTGGAGANNVGVRLVFAAPNSLGTQTFAGFVTATITDVTNGAEVSQLSLGGTFANGGCEAIRLLAVTGTIVNRLDITPAADSGVVTVAVAGGGTAGSLALSCNGVTGVTSLRGSVATNIIAVDNGGGASAPRLGFFNVTPLVRQTVADCVVAADGTSAGTQLNDLLAKLRLFGLLT